MRTYHILAFLLPLQSVALRLERRAEPKILLLPIQHTSAPVDEVEHLLWRRFNAAQVPINNDRYYNHDVNITLGNPPQHLRALIDTGSAFTLIHANSSDFCRLQQWTCSALGSCTYFFASREYLLMTNTDAANDSLTYKYLESGFGAGYWSGEVATGDFVMDEMGIGGIKVKDAQVELMYKGNCTENVLGLAWVICSSPGMHRWLDI